MWCNEPVMEQEEQYLETILTAESVQIKDDKLRIGGQGMFVFKCK
jgi:heat shock protein HslJ